mmetsp:Transcript_17469/g.29400  ORF Transcript_17469/g.29400 Transcript_17469/m.29400 type:complete len:111 (-) Transcript_17469:217-549(-)
MAIKRESQAAREKYRFLKTGIISVSSGMCFNSYPGVATYAATKGFVSFMMGGVVMEQFEQFEDSKSLYRKKIDYLAYTPLGMATNFLKGLRMPDAIPADQAVSPSLRDLN